MGSAVSHCSGVTAGCVSAVAVSMVSVPTASAATVSVSVATDLVTSRSGVGDATSASVGPFDSGRAASVSGKIDSKGAGSSNLGGSSVATSPSATMGSTGSQGAESTAKGSVAAGPAPSDDSGSASKRGGISRRAGWISGGEGGSASASSSAGRSSADGSSADGSSADRSSADGSSADGSSAEGGSSVGTVRSAEHTLQLPKGIRCRCLRRRQSPSTARPKERPPAAGDRPAARVRRGGDRRESSLAQRNLLRVDWSSSSVKGLPR